LPVRASPSLLVAGSFTNQTVPRGGPGRILFPPRR